MTHYCIVVGVYHSRGGLPLTYDIIILNHAKEHLFSVYKIERHKMKKYRRYA